MAKLDLLSIGVIAQAAPRINANNQRTALAMENTLSRDGTAPNEMNAELDMNNNRIYNLPPPTLSTEPIRKYELDNFPARLEGWTPELAVVNDGFREVLQVIDWFGGQGEKPASGVYLGAAGFTFNIAEAVNIKGTTGTPGSVSDGDKGDVVVTGGGTVWTVDTLVGDSGAGGAKGAAPAPASGDTAAGKVLTAAGNWAVPPYYMSGVKGLTLSNNGTDVTNDIDIAAGYAVSDDAVPRLMKLTSGITKRLDAAWAVGTGNGGLDTGAIADTTYHLWLIQRSDTGVVDVLFSASATSPTMPANYDRKCPIGSIIRSGSAILRFVQNKNEFSLYTPVRLAAITNPGTGAVSRTLTVPTGVKVKAFINFVAGSQAAIVQAVYFSSLDTEDLAASRLNAPLASGAINAVAQAQIGGNVDVWTNTSGQVRSRVEQSDGTTTLYIVTTGWLDPRI